MIPLRAVIVYDRYHHFQNLRSSSCFRRTSYRGDRGCIESTRPTTSFHLFKYRTRHGRANPSISPISSRSKAPPLYYVFSSDDKLTPPPLHFSTTTVHRVARLL